MILGMSDIRRSTADFCAALVAGYDMLCANPRECGTAGIAARLLQASAWMVAGFPHESFVTEQAGRLQGRFSSGQGDVLLPYIVR